VLEHKSYANWLIDSVAALTAELEHALADESSATCSSGELDVCVVWLRSPKLLADTVGHITHVEFPELIEGWIRECLHAGSKHRIAMFSWILEDASVEEVVERVRRRRADLNLTLAKRLAEDGRKIDDARRILDECDPCPAATGLKLRVGSSEGSIADRLLSALSRHVFTGFRDPNWPTILVV